MSNRFTPGCFGSPLCYKATLDVCRACIFAVQCAPVAATRLQALHAHFGVKVKPPKPVPLAAAPIVLKPAANPKMLFIAKILRSGRNPFLADKLKQRVYWAICQLLLKKRAGVPLKLIAVFTGNIIYSFNRAQVHARKFLLELSRAGGVVQRGDLFAIAS